MKFINKLKMFSLVVYLHLILVASSNPRVFKTDDGKTKIMPLTFDANGESFAFSMADYSSELKKTVYCGFVSQNLNMIEASVNPNVFYRAGLIVQDDS